MLTVCVGSFFRQLAGLAHLYVYIVKHGLILKLVNHNQL